MPSKVLNLNSSLAVFLLIVMAFLLCVVPVSGKTALGGSEFSLGHELEKSLSNPLTLLEKKLSCRSRVSGICDGPENNVSTNNTANAGTNAGGADAEVGTPYGGYDPRTSSINYDEISTAKPHQATSPRDLNEQVLWNQVVDNPASGKPLIGLNNDPRFPPGGGWQKMSATQRLPDGSTIDIHYQYNLHTGKAYDMKIDTPQRTTQHLQPGPSFEDN